jgi:hypothetical protein
VTGNARAWIAALLVSLVTAGLIVIDCVDAGVRDFFARHALTTSTLSGILVLLVTVLVADRVLARRSLQDRSRAIAAQASLVYGQALRARDAVVALVTDDTADEAAEEAAGEESRTYTMAVMIATPTLIEVSATRDFLEAAQALGAHLALTLTRRSTLDRQAATERIDAAVEQLRERARPLVSSLSPGLRAAVEGFREGDAPDLSE